MGKVSVDPQHNEIFIANGDETILVLDQHGPGECRAEEDFGQGPDTQLETERRQWNLRARRPRFTPLAGACSGGIAGGRVLIFDRAASGKYAAEGDLSKGQWRAGQSVRDLCSQIAIGYIPSRLEYRNLEKSRKWREHRAAIENPGACGPRRQYRDRIVLDPLHKEVIIATAAGNSIMTFLCAGSVRRVAHHPAGDSLELGAEIGAARRRGAAPNSRGRRELLPNAGRARSRRQFSSCGLVVRPAALTASIVFAAPASASAARTIPQPGAVWKRDVSNTTDRVARFGLMDVNGDSRRRALRKSLVQPRRRGEAEGRRVRQAQCMTLPLSSLTSNVIME